MPWMQNFSLKRYTIKRPEKLLPAPFSFAQNANYEFLLLNKSKTE